MATPISLQSGLGEYHGNLSQYTGMLGGLTPDIHTLKSLSPLTTNRVIVVMYRGPYFLQHYFGGKNAYASNSAFSTYKKMIEYYNVEISTNIQDQTLASTTLQGGFAGRSIVLPTQQNAQTGQTLTIKVPELMFRPVANFHNMWVNGIADGITGLTHYHGLVAGSVDENNIPQRVFSPVTGADSSDIALEPSPAWEVAEFLIIALDRSGSRPEAAVMALGAFPNSKVGSDIFNMNNQGNSQIQTLSLTYNCTYVESAFINDLAMRYVKQFAVLGNSLNFNPGAGDAFFNDRTSTSIDTPMFNGGKRPSLDSVQSGLGNAPVFRADNQPVSREASSVKTITPGDHSQIYMDNNTTTDINNPYSQTTTNA